MTEDPRTPTLYPAAIFIVVFTLASNLLSKAVAWIGLPFSTPLGKSPDLAPHAISGLTSLSAMPASSPSSSSEENPPAYTKDDPAKVLQPSATPTSGVRTAATLSNTAEYGTRPHDAPFASNAAIGRPVRLYTTPIRCLFLFAYVFAVTFVVFGILAAAIYGIYRLYAAVWTLDSKAEAIMFSVCIGAILLVSLWYVGCYVERAIRGRKG